MKKFMKSKIQNSMDLLQKGLHFEASSESDVFIDFKVVSDF